MVEQGRETSSPLALEAWGRALSPDGAPRKCLKLVVFASLIGFLDDIQVRYLEVARLGNTAEIVYQGVFMAAAGAVAFLVLHNSAWSRNRNLYNLLMAIPLATLADNVSIDFGTLRPYFGIIPQQGYVWRTEVFARSQGLSQLAAWVNGQNLAPGLINGYAAAAAVMGAYLLLQFVWMRRSRDAAP